MFLDFVPLLILVVVVYKDLPTHLYDSFLFVTFFGSWDLLQKMKFSKTLKSCCKLGMRKWTLTFLTAMAVSAASCVVQVGALRDAGRTAGEQHES